MAAISVSLINMKGGVGKTTLVAQLSYAAAQKGHRTLAVDLDPQANLSQALLSPEDYAQHLWDKKPTIVQIFDQYSPPTEGASSPRPIDLSAIILKDVGFWEPPRVRLPRDRAARRRVIAARARTAALARSKLHLIPSQLELSHVLEDPPKGMERRLAEAVAKIVSNYDLVLIDCPPTESLLTKAAYHASRYALVPVKPEFLATIGLPLLARSIRTFKDKNTHHSLDICGIVFNHSSSYSVGPEGRRSIREVQTLARENRWHVFDSQVPHSRSYAKAAREGRPIGSTSHARWYRSEEFSRVVDEFLRAIGLIPSPSLYD